MSTEPKIPMPGETADIYLITIDNHYIKVKADAIEAWNLWMAGVFGWSEVNQAYVSCSEFSKNPADYWRLIKEKQG